MDAAADSRARRWAWFAGRLVSWSLNTTTTRSRSPDERVLTWLGLSLEKLGAGTLARAAEPAAKLVPVIAVMPSAAAPSNEAALRRVEDILPPPFWPSAGLPGRNPSFGCYTLIAAGSRLAVLIMAALAIVCVIVAGRRDDCRSPVVTAMITASA